MEAFFAGADEGERLERGHRSFRLLARLPDLEHGFRIAGESRIRVLNVHAPNVGFVERVQ